MISFSLIVGWYLFGGLQLHLDIGARIRAVAHYSDASQLSFCYRVGSSAHTLNDLQRGVESRVRLELLINLSVQLLTNLLGDGIAINLNANHID